MRPLFPRYTGALLALLCIGLALGYAFSSETPVGRVQGRVVIAGMGKPLSDVRVRLTPAEGGGDAAVSRQARTGADGRFSVHRVPAGKYYASAFTRAHRIDQAVVQVDEGGTARVSLALKRSEPDLQVAQHQRVFATGEKPFLPVRGYVDGKKPAGKDAVRVRVFATRLSHVLQSEGGTEALEGIGRAYGEKPSRLPRVLLEPPAGNAPRLLWERDLPIIEADREGFFHKRIPLETAGAGLYLVDVAHGKKSVCSWVVATDTALIVKRAGRQLMTYTVDMKTGAPVAGAAVRVYRGGRAVASNRSDVRGLARMDVPAQGRDGARLMTVALRGGGDEAVLGRNDYAFEEQGSFTLHAYTDRPIYRPGQRIFYKGILRAKGGALGRYSVPDAEPVTVEIRDPNGERILRRQSTTNSYGSFHGSVELSPEAPTGTFSLVAEVHGEKHTHDIVVAAYRKPEFAVTVTPGRKRYVRGEPIEMTVEGKFYFGAPLAGARVKYSVYRDTDWSAEYPDDYELEEGEAAPSGGGYEGYYGQTVTEGAATLDANGRAVIRFAADVPEEEDAPQEQIFTLHATVTDAARREADAQGAARVSAGDFRLSVRPEGYVAEPGKPTTVVVAARDHDGKPLADVPIALESVYGAWNEKAGAYETQPAGTQNAATGPDGSAVVTVTPPRPGELRLHARATDAKGRQIRARGYLWAASDEGGDLQTEYADLSLLTDRRRYLPGDTARVLVNTARTGQTVLLTVEGEKIHRTFSVPVTRRSTLVRVPVEEAYGPNVTLAACYVQNKRFASSETPLRVTLPESELTVQVAADRARYRPGDPITYTIRTTDKRGRPAPCELSFGVVDESIYALREDDPKALRNAFYPRRYNSVSTSYSFAVEYLGDADKAEPDIEARKRFPDTAYWEPALRTNAAGRATIRFRLPDNLTTWRATVLAHSVGTAVGREINKVVAAKDFFVRVETARFLTQGDRSRLLALVHNDTGAAQTALVRLSADGLRVEGDETRTLSLQPGQIGQASWPVQADGTSLPQGGGYQAKVRVTAWTPKSGAARQYTDGVETTLAVRPHGRDRFDSAGGALTGETARTEVVDLDAAAVPQSSRLVVRVTPSVRGALVGALEYVIGYPYGCTEQTMSRFLPDLLVQRLERQHGSVLAADQARELPRMVRDGLSRLYRFQNEEGGWGWWEHDGGDPWMTAYVLYGLATAQAEGYAVSNTVLEKGREAAAKLLTKPSRDDRGSPAANLDADNKAFLMYALALAGGKDAARAARARVALDALSPDGLAYRVLLDRLLGDGGDEAMALLDRRAVSADGMLHWEAGEERWDSSDRMSTALALRAILAVDPADDRVAPALRWLMADRTGDHWGSTRDTSWVLAALCDYLTHYPDDAAPAGDVHIRLNGRLLKTYPLTPDLVREPELVLRVPPSDLRPGRNEVTLERAGGTSTVFYAVSLRQTVAMDPIPALTAQGIAVEREYLRVLPRRVGFDAWTLQTEPTGGDLRQGDRVRVRLTLTAPRDLAYVLIEDAFPSGCEVTERGESDETVEWGFWYSSVDVRDDRVAFFARTLRKGRHVIEYNLRAQTPGTYRALPTLLQAMYAPELRAESAEARVEVR